MPRRASQKDLERALRVAAQIVVIHGDWAVPIFDKLERELERRKAASAATQRAALMLLGEDRGVGSTQNAG